MLEWVPSPGDLPDPGIDLRLLHWQVDSLPLRPQGGPAGSSFFLLFPKSGSPVFTAAPSRDGGARLCLGSRWLQPPEALGSLVEHREACFTRLSSGALLLPALPLLSVNPEARRARRQAPRLTRAASGVRCALVFTRLVYS